MVSVVACNVCLLKHYWLYIQIKKHLKNGKNVSMGFGFLEFDSVDTAANVCRDLQVIICFMVLYSSDPLVVP